MKLMNIEIFGIIKIILILSSKKESKGQLRLSLYLLNFAIWQFSDLRQHSFIISKSCRDRKSRLMWDLWSWSYNVEIKVLVRMGSSLKALGKKLLSGLYKLVKFSSMTWRHDDPSSSLLTVSLDHSQQLETHLRSLYDALHFKPTTISQSQASYFSDFPLFLLGVENSLLLKGSCD